MLMAPFLPDKKSTVHFGIAIDINRRHAGGFETHRAAPVGILSLIGNIEMFTEETIDEGAFFFVVGH
jgi:hypothetical protein